MCKKVQVTVSEVAITRGWCVVQQPGQHNSVAEQIRHKKKKKKKRFKKIIVYSKTSKPLRAAPKINIGFIYVSASGFK